MQQPGKTGVWVSTNPLSQKALAELAQGVERLGYDVLWYPESLAYESLALGGFLLGETSKLCVASGIANIYARDPMTMRAAQLTLGEMAPGRFVLGLGVSHANIVSGLRGHEYKAPVPAMRSYLDAMEKSVFTSLRPESEPPIVIGAISGNVT